jgi:hypothetical protein
VVTSDFGDEQPVLLKEEAIIDLLYLVQVVLGGGVRFRT